MQAKQMIIYTVSGMWVLNLVAGMIPPLQYDPSEAVNGIFMVIVGSLFVAKQTDHKTESKDEGSKEIDQGEHS